jgi:hypothetical protein
MYVALLHLHIYKTATYDDDAAVDRNVSLPVRMVTFFKNWKFVTVLLSELLSSNFLLVIGNLRGNCLSPDRRRT